MEVGLKNFPTVNYWRWSLWLKGRKFWQSVRFLKTVRMNEGQKNEELQGIETSHETKSSGKLAPSQYKLFSETQRSVNLFFLHCPQPPPPPTP